MHHKPKIDQSTSERKSTVSDLTLFRIIALICGSVSLSLYKGNVTVASRRSQFSLYRTSLASFTMTGYNPKDAEGFINLFALPVIIPEEAKPR